MSADTLSVGVTCESWRTHSLADLFIFLNHRVCLLGVFVVAYLEYGRVECPWRQLKGIFLQKVQGEEGRTFCKQSSDDRLETRSSRHLLNIFLRII